MAEGADGGGKLQKPSTSRVWTISCEGFPRKEVLVVAALKKVLDTLGKNLEAPYLRSVIECLDVVPDKLGSCPTGFSALQGVCQLAPGETGFSGSAFCPSPSYVMNRALKREGTLHMCKTFGHFFALFVLGPLIDVWGRRPVIMVSLATNFFETLLFALAATLQRQHLSVKKFMLLGMILAGGADAFHPAISSMVADLSKANVGGRANSFSTLKITFLLGAVSAVGMGFAVLRLRLTDYTWVWLALAGLSGLLLAFAFCTLQESSTAASASPDAAADRASALPDAADGKEAPRSEVCKRGLRMLQEVARLVRQDRIVMNYIFVQFFLVTAFSIAQELLHPFLISHLGYTQQLASLAALVFLSSQLVGNAASRALLRRFGPLLVYGGSLVAVAMGFFLMGLTGTCDALAQPIFWSGVVLAATSFGMNDTAGTVLLSLRVGGGAMGALFSLEHSMGLIGGLLGTALSTRKLFDASATGWHRSSCFTYCSCFLGCAALWYFIAYCVLRPWEDDFSDSSTEADSDSDSTSEGPAE